MKNWLYILGLNLVVFLAHAKFETTIIEKSFRSSAKVIIDEEQIKNSKASNVGTLLATEANITISNSAFQPNSLFVRGGDSGQVLILIDGLPVYDPSTKQRSFNLNSLNVNSIKKITIVKGSQSVWYGGQALSAVIKIETLPSANDKLATGQLATGSDNAKIASLGLQTQLLENNYVFFRTDFQQQDQRSPVDGSDFKYQKRKDNFDIGYLNHNESKFYIKASQYSDRNENVTGVSYLDFAAADTLDFITMNDSQQILASYSDATVAWKPLLTVGFIQTQRQFNYGISSYNSKQENQDYKGSIIPIRGEIRLINSATTRWDLGLSYQKETMLYNEFEVEKANSFNEMKGYFTKIEHDLSSGVAITAGLRNDTDLHFSAVNTYQVGLGYENYKFEYATGYRLPSLYQLYSNKGNTNLNPEFSRTYSLSSDYEPADNFKVSITLFETHIENLIAGKGNPMQYYNTGRTVTKGIEVGSALLLTEFDVIKASVAYQEPKDVNSGQWLTKLPLQSGSFAYIKKLPDGSLTFELIGRGERIDSKSSSQTVSLPGYMVLNTSYICKLNPDWDLFFRGNNLLSEKYQETYGFYDRGLSFQVGTDISF